MSDEKSKEIALSLGGVGVRVHPTAYVAPNAVLVGDVTLEEDSSVWYGAVLRGDLAPIVVGAGSNLQDGVLVHVRAGGPTRLGRGVTVGHGAVLHDCTIADNVLVGMQATVLGGAVIGEDSLIAAGALVSEGMVVPPRSVVMGVPARVKREADPELVESIRASAQRYIRYAAIYREHGSTRGLEVTPLGVVRNGEHDVARTDWDDVESLLVLDERWAEHLEGIEGFSHLDVLFWLDRVERQGLAPRLHPRDRADLPLVGVFATRTQYRPNPVGVTRVRLLERRGCTLRVRGLDALDGTPILDLKPALPCQGADEELRVPAWLRELQR